jgi:hypothetical protein
MRIGSIGRRIIWFVSACAVAIAVFLWAENNFSRSFQNCVACEAAKQNAESANEYGKIIRVIGAQIVCTIHLVDRHNGFFGLLATLVIAAFTVVLAFVSNRQARLTSAAIEVARDEFNATHRPRIILREAIISPVLEGEPVVILFHLANIGETEGIIVRSTLGAEVIPRQARLLLQGGVEMKNDLGEVRLGPGAAILLTFKGSPPKWEAARFEEKTYMSTSGPITYREATIHFFGELIYVDKIGTPRRTTFRRELIPEKRRFYRIKDEPDLDYSD